MLWALSPRVALNADCVPTFRAYGSVLHAHLRNLLMLRRAVHDAASAAQSARNDGGIAASTGGDARGSAEPATAGVLRPPRHVLLQSPT